MMNRMKRILSIVLALAVMLSCIAPFDVTAFAIEDAKPTILVESKSVVSGTDAILTVSVVNNPGIAGAKIALNYSEKLTLTEAINGTDFSDLDYTAPPTLENGCVFNWDSLDAEVKKDGILLTLKFKVSTEAEANEVLPVSITYEFGDIYDADLESVDFDVENGAVKVINYIPGDVNGDNTVNGKDVTLIRRYNAGYSVSINQDAADVNDDGTINGKDVTLIRRYNAGYTNVVLKPSTPKCSHDLQATVAKAVTCEENGNIAYWHCTKCDKYYNSATATKEISLADTVIAALGEHTIVVDQAVSATYTSTGLTEGSHCSVCGKVLVAQEITPILRKTEYNITYNIAGNDTYLQSLNIENPNPSVYTEGTEVLLQELEVTGYVFEGWYDGQGTSATRVTKIDKNSKGNVRLYAKWNLADAYHVVFKYDKELASLIDVSKLENFTYNVNSAKALPVLSLAGYTFIGWSDENGVLCDQIYPGTIGNKTYYANWISDRNKAWKAKDIGNPYVYEDDNLIMFTYEIGKVENVPVYEIEDFGKIIAGGISESRTKEVSVEMSESLVQAYSSAIEKSTTGNATWTLSDGWTDSMSISEEWAEEHGTTAEKVKEQSTSETGNWYVNKSSGGSKTDTVIDTTDTYDLKTTTNNKTTYDSKDETEYDSGTTEKGWNVGGSLELGAKEKLSTEVSAGIKNSASASASVPGVGSASAGTEVSAGVKIETGLEFEQKLTASGGYESKGTDKTGTDTVKKSGEDNVEGSGTQTGTIKNHSENTVTSSNWSNESGFGGSNTIAESTKVAQAISELISSKTGYGKSYIQTGNSSKTQGLSTTNSNQDSFSSQVTYSTVTQEKQIVTYSTGAAVTGFHRWVMATTAHVFGIVGYDKEKESYFTTTYTVMDDKLQKFQDYSYKTGAYNDNQSGVIDFCIPSEVTNYVKARVFATEGLEFDLNGYVTAYTGSDSAVVIPEYVSIDNLDNTRKLVKVVGIKENAFKGNKNITGVALSDFITEIPANAFAGCSELWDVFGVGIVKIGEKAFAGCDKLRSFELSSAITQLGNGAFSSTGFLEVTAKNVSVIEAALNSGAKEIVIDLNEFEGTLDEKKLVIPEGTECITIRGYGKTYTNLTIESHARETKINRLNSTIINAEPLKLESDEVVLCQSSFNAKGTCAVMNNAATNLSLYGEVRIASNGENAVFCKNATISQIDGNLYTRLNIKGNFVTCQDVKGSGFLNFSQGKVVIVSETDYDKLLHSYKLYFNANGGSCATASKEVPNGTPVGTLPTASRENYTFDGWYTAASGGERVDADKAYSTATDITLYAHWTRKTYTITFDANGGSVGTKTKVVNCGDAVSGLPTPTREYYTFNGWYNEKEGGYKLIEGTVPEIQSNRTLYAHWTRNTYTITFDANGGSVSTKSKVVNCGDKVSGLPIPTRDYYNFDGWYSAKEGGSKLVDGSVPEIQSNRTVYAHWTFKATSSWVKATEMPSGAQVVNRKYTYTQRSYTESGSSSLNGWTRYDAKRTSWTAWSDWTRTYPDNGVRNVERRDAFDHKQYHYYRWTNSNHDAAYTYQTSNYNCYIFEETWFDYELPASSRGWPVCYDGSDSNYSTRWMRADYEGNYSCDRTYTRDVYHDEWRYQDPVYTYYYYQDNNKESSSRPSGDNISNIVEWVQYRAK